RWRNAPHLGEWETAVTSDNLPAIEAEHLIPRHRASELAMLLLRLSRGLNFADSANRTNFDARSLWRETIDRYTRAGLLAVDTESMRLSESGLAVADSLASEFLDLSK